MTQESWETQALKSLGEVEVGDFIYHHSDMHYENIQIVVAKIGDRVFMSPVRELTHPTEWIRREIL